MKLLGSTKDKINKYKNGENVSHLEITEIVLVHCDIDDQEYYIPLLQVNLLVVY